MNKQVVSDAVSALRTEYYKAVQQIAEEAIENASDYFNREQFISESVDGSEWVIYTGNALTLALVSDNFNAYLDDAHDGSNLDSVRAYCAMHADVTRAVNLLEEAAA